MSKHTIRMARMSWPRHCVVEIASGQYWTGCWTNCAQVTAGCWSCAVRRESARPSCWTTRRSARLTVGLSGRSGLSDADARAWLESVVPGRLDQRVQDRIVAETRGTRLALVELTRGLTAAELAGGFGRPDTRPLASRLEQSFHRQLRSLPDETQLLLLTVAAE